MPRSSISFTPPNDKWIQEQIDSQEFNSKSDVINDLIRRARRESEAEIEAIRAALIKGEESGISSRSLEDIWQEARDIRAKLIQSEKSGLSNRTPEQIMADVLTKRQLS